MRSTRTPNDTEVAGSWRSPTRTQFKRVPLDHALRSVQLERRSADLALISISMNTASGKYCLTSQPSGLCS